MKFQLKQIKGDLFLVPKVVDIERYPFAYRREVPKGLPDVEEIVFPLPTKPHRRTKEVEWRKFWKTRRKQLGEEPGWSPREALPSIGKPKWEWDWMPGQKGYRTEVVADIYEGRGETWYLRPTTMESPKLLTKEELEKMVDTSVLYELIETIENVWLIGRVPDGIRYKMPRGFYYPAGEDEEFKYFKSVDTGVFVAVEKDRVLPLREVRKKKLFFI
jgi:hypothetical protein